jgi:hypothetical protein
MCDTAAMTALQFVLWILFGVALQVSVTLYAVRYFKRSMRRLALRMAHTARTTAEALGHVIPLFEDLGRRDPVIAEAVEIGRLESIENQRLLLRQAEEFDSIAADTRTWRALINPGATNGRK